MKLALARSPARCTLVLLACIALALTGCLPLLRRSNSQKDDSLLRQRLAPQQPVMATVRSQALNVRSCPGTKCKVVGVLHAGSRVEELERQGGWSRIQTPSGTLKGWVANAHLLRPDIRSAPAAGHGPPLPPEELAR